MHLFYRHRLTKVESLIFKLKLGGGEGVLECWDKVIFSGKTNSFDLFCCCCCCVIAIKGKVFSMNQLSSGYTLQFNVSRVIIKHGFSFRGSLAQIWSQTNYSCFDDGTCTYLEKGKDFVILGHKSGTGKLILGWAWALPRDKHLMDKLKTWKAESKKKKSKD